MVMRPAANRYILRGAEVRVLHSPLKRRQNMKKVNVLGTEYTIIERPEEEDERLKKHDGYCDSSTKTIVLLKYEDDPMNKEDMSYFRKQILRHEIIHAFLSESGLEACGNSFGGSWALNEEMVDWIAIQAPKLFAAFSEVDAIDMPTHTVTNTGSIAEVRTLPPHFHKLEDNKG